MFHALGLDYLRVDSDRTIKSKSKKTIVDGAITEKWVSGFLGHGVIIETS